MSSLSPEKQEQIDSLLAILKEHPAKKGPAIRLAEIYKEVGKIDEAIDIYRDLLKRYPDDVVLASKLRAIHRPVRIRKIKSLEPEKIPEPDEINSTANTDEKNVSIEAQEPSLTPKPSQELEPTQQPITLSTHPPNPQTSPTLPKEQPMPRPPAEPNLPMSPFVKRKILLYSFSASSILILGIFVVLYLTYRTAKIYKSPHALNSPTLSPDGRQLVFLQFERNLKGIMYPGRGEPFVTKLQLLDMKTETLEAIDTTDIGFTSHIEWSPNGKSLAYSDFGMYSSGLVVLDLTTRTKKHIKGAQSFSWSPDSSRIVYAKSTYKRPEYNIVTGEWEYGDFRSTKINLYIYDLFTKQEKQITKQGARSPVWSADDKIAFITYTAGSRASMFYFLSMMIQGGNDKISSLSSKINNYNDDEYSDNIGVYDVTADTIEQLTDTGNCLAPRWVRDNKSLLFAKKTRTDYKQNYEDLDLWSMNIETKETNLLVSCIPNIIHTESFTQSADLRYLAFSGSLPEEPGSLKMIDDCYILDIETRKIKRLENKHTNKRQPCFCPQSQTLLYIYGSKSEPNAIFADTFSRLSGWKQYI